MCFIFCFLTVIVDFCCCREFHYNSVKVHAYGVNAAVCYHDCSVVREKVQWWKQNVRDLLGDRFWFCDRWFLLQSVFIVQPSHYEVTLHWALYLFISLANQSCNSNRRSEKVQILCGTFKYNINVVFRVKDQTLRLLYLTDTNFDVIVEWIA